MIRKRQKSYGWFISSETKPETSQDVENLADEQGYEPEEVQAIGTIASRQALAINPFVVIDSMDVGGFGIEVIIPPADENLLEVYAKYNGGL